jgi:hypothetical protein
MPRDDSKMRNIGNRFSESIQSIDRINLLCQYKVGKNNNELVHAGNRGRMGEWESVLVVLKELSSEGFIHGKGGRAAERRV